MIKLSSKFKNSWEFDGICKICEQNESECICKEKIFLPHEHKLAVFAQKIKGKQVTIAKDFFISKDLKNKLLKEAKKRLSVGGGFKNHELILQGNKSQDLENFLKEKGFGLR